jgi:hypothetical protein
MTINNEIIPGFNDEEMVFPKMYLYQDNENINTLIIKIVGFIDDDRSISVLQRFKKININKWKYYLIICDCNYLNPFGLLSFSYLDKKTNSEGRVAVFSSNGKTVDVIMSFWDEIYMPLQYIDDLQEYTFMNISNNIDKSWIKKLDIESIEKKII